MKPPLAICVLSLFAGAAAQTASQGVRDRFVGAWRLVSLERRSLDGQAHVIECCGLFVFTRDGHMSVQVRRRDAESPAQAGSDRYSQGGYEATYGTYAIDESKRTFTIHVEGSLAGELIGRDLPRLYEFSGKRLIVKPADPSERWKVTWEHY